MTMDPIPMPHASRQPPEGRDEIREATASFTRMIAQAVLGYQRWAEQPREVLVRQNEAWVGGRVGHSVLFRSVHYVLFRS